MTPLLAALLLVAQGAPSAGGQSAGPRLALEPRPWSTAVAVVVAFPGGSAEDPPGSGGLSRVMADAVVRAAASKGPAGAVFAADVTRDGTFFSTLASLEAWQDAYRALVGALLGPTLPESEIAEARAALLASLRAEAGAAVREVELEIWRALLGAAHPWARPAAGNARSVERLAPRRAQEWFAGRFRARDAIVAVVGPVDTAARAALVAPWQTAPEGPALATPSTPTPAPEGQARRVTLFGEVTSTWIAVALPVAAGTPPAAGAFLAHYLEEQLTAVPRDPALFDASVRVERFPWGDGIVAAVVVTPEDAERWERRIGEAVERLRHAPLPGPTFDATWRRFRSALALRLAYPEQAARWHAEALLREGRPSDPMAEVAELTAEGIAGAARGLAPATVLVYGPELKNQ